MGIYDRDYYRRSGPSFLASFTERGRVCKWLIAINVGIFVVQLLSTPKEEVVRDRYGEVTSLERPPSPVTEALILDTDAVMHGQVWRLLTYAFLHDFSLLHILFNMLFLWWFGSDVEDLYGPREFLAFYLISALAGGIAFTAWELGTGAPARCLGASGAVTAVMVLFALHYPTRMIYIWFFLPIPIWLFVIFQVVQDSFVFLSGMRTGTAVVVHLAGAAFGFLYYKLQWRLLNFLPNLRSLQRARSRPRLRVYREEAPQPVSVAAPPASAAGAEVDEQLEAKMDAVLEKVKRSGMGSLTETEKQILVRASEVLRRRKS